VARWVAGDRASARHQLVADSGARPDSAGTDSVSRIRRSGEARTQIGARQAPMAQAHNAARLPSQLLSLPCSRGATRRRSQAVVTG
jgi:hypothetical protein